MEVCLCSTATHRHYMYSVVSEAACLRYSVSSHSLACRLVGTVTQEHDIMGQTGDTRLSMFTAHSYGATTTTATTQQHRRLYTTKADSPKAVTSLRNWRAHGLLGGCLRLTNTF